MKTQVCRFILLRPFISLILLLFPYIIDADTPEDQSSFPRQVIAVKFIDGIEIRLQKGVLDDRGAGILEKTHEILREIEGVRWHNPYGAVEMSRLNQYMESARYRLGREVSDITLRFNLVLPDDVDAIQIAESLESLDIVEYALPFPEPIEPPGVPDFRNYQEYKSGAPSGTGIRDVWHREGIFGENVKIVDIEYDFNKHHVDLPDVVTLGGLPYDIYGNNHGTAVLGILGARDNGWGITGMVHGAGIYFHHAHNVDSVYDVGGAIINSLPFLNEGDVILIEQQLAGPNYELDEEGRQSGFVPVEWFKPWYDDIVVAVGQGMIVVQAAGNGSEDLDAPVYSTENNGHYPFRTENDSGAIIVGAGASKFSDDNARSRLWYSNYGSRVDLQGWGGGVWATGYGDAYDEQGENFYYTQRFGGTSSASAIVAGAAVLVQSVYKSRYNSVISPDDLRKLLRVTGSPQVSGLYSVRENIGPLPNVYGAVSMNLTDVSQMLLPVLYQNFPNPVSASGNITFGTNLATTIRFILPEPSRVSLKIYNTLGQEVTALHTGYLSAGTYNYIWTAENVAAGMYFYRMNTDHFTKTRKIIVVR